MGAALLMMAASLAKTRTGSSDDRSALDAAHRVLVDIERQLTEAIDADGVAYERVIAARGQPNTSDLERTGRVSASQQALRDATDGPASRRQSVGGGARASPAGCGARAPRG